MNTKRLVWMGSSLEDIRDFPEDVRRRAGFELRAVQRGLTPSDFKPMNGIGMGTQEIRIRTADAFRVFYVARFEEAVYVLHAFQKKSQRTSRKDVAAGQQRYQEMLTLRRQTGREKP